MRACHSLQLITGGTDEQDRPKASRAEEEGREPRQASERLIERDYSKRRPWPQPGPVAIESHVTTNERDPQSLVDGVTESAYMVTI